MADSLEPAGARRRHGRRVLGGPALRGAGTAQTPDRGIPAQRAPVHHPSGRRVQHHLQARRPRWARPRFTGDRLASMGVLLARPLSEGKALPRAGALLRGRPVPVWRGAGLHLDPARRLQGAARIPERRTGADHHRGVVLQLRIDAHPGVRAVVRAAIDHHAAGAVWRDHPGVPVQEPAVLDRRRRGGRRGAHADARCAHHDLDDDSAPAAVRSRNRSRPGGLPPAEPGRPGGRHEYDRCAGPPPSPRRGRAGARAGTGAAAPGTAATRHPWGSHRRAAGRTRRSRRSAARRHRRRPPDGTAHRTIPGHAAGRLGHARASAAQGLQGHPFCRRQPHLPRRHPSHRSDWCRDGGTGRKHVGGGFGPLRPDRMPDRRGRGTQAVR